MVLSLDSLAFKDYDPNRKKKAIKDERYNISNTKIDESKISYDPIDFLFLKSMKRDDYDQFFTDVYSQAPESKLYLDIRLIKTAKAKLNGIFSILKYSPYFFLCFIWFGNSAKYTFYKFIKYKRMQNILIKMNFKYLVVFADMQAVDNMIVQWAKLNNIKTVTLQHGLYVDYEDFKNINCVNYKNAVSDYFLAWGEETKELIKKYHPNITVKIVGKPIQINDNYKSTGEYFTVLFDQNIFEDYNKKILSSAYLVAKTMHLKVNIRFHPYNNRNNYSIEDNITLVNEPLNNSEFVIGHTTSMIYEVMRLGIPVFKLKTEIPSNQIDPIFLFENEDDLLKKLRITNQIDFSEKGKYYIDCFGEKSLLKYKNFLIDLKNNTI